MTTNTTLFFIWVFETCCHSFAHQTHPLTCVLVCVCVIGCPPSVTLELITTYWNENPRQAKASRCHNSVSNSTNVDSCLLLYSNYHLAADIELEFVGYQKKEEKQERQRGGGNGGGGAAGQGRVVSGLSHCFLRAYFTYSFDVSRFVFLIVALGYKSRIEASTVECVCSLCVSVWMNVRLRLRLVEM